MWPRLRIFVGLVLLQLPWVRKPVHYDEANFLTLARGAAADPWRPHDILINWQGTTERAFDVLSNPPGIAWWLAPVVDTPVWVQRLWMLPWWIVAVFGAWKLGRRFVGDATEGALLLLTAPIVILSGMALLPDLPLYACVLLGVGGFVDAIDRDRPAAGWALVAGCATLFRYSGIVLPPLLFAYALWRGRSPWAALTACVPLALLAAHDLGAYGRIHLFAMSGFQSIANTPFDWFHKGVASVCFLGGAAALPLFRWRAAHFVGAVIGACVAVAWGPLAAGFGALGGAAIASLVVERRFLALWGLGGLLFLLTLRFTATRYWLPFLPAVLLARPRSAPWVQVLVQLSLGVLLLADEAADARANQALADRVAALGTGGFTGHWGWQWELEAKGWHALEADSHPSGLVAVPTEAWPQPLGVACVDPMLIGDATPPLSWLPRGYSRAGRANLHANWIAGAPPVRTVIPWTFAVDAYETARVCEIADRPAP